MPEVTKAEGDAPEKRFGRYRVLKELGTGAMGAVYLASDEVLGRNVAIKTIRPRGLYGSSAETFRARFANEAKAAAALSHPNIVNLFDIGCEGDTPFLVMEVVAGISLKERIAQTALEMDDVRRLGIQIARALDAAHARGIVHRDVKPANILDATDGQWKLADFGVARIPDSSLTLTGQFLGSPAYSAPEALEQGELGPASDVYGLGATLYECVTGQPPYGERGMLSIVAMASKAEPVAISTLNPEIPIDLAKAIMRAVSRAAAKRPTAAKFASALASSATNSGVFATATPVAGRPRRLAMIAAAGVLVTGMLAAFATTRRNDAVPAARRSERGEEPPIEAQPISLMPGFGYSPPAASSDDEHEAQWQRVQQELANGDLGDAREELQNLVSRYPDDEEARALLERLSTRSDQDRHGDKKQHRHDHHRHHED